MEVVRAVGDILSLLGHQLVMPTRFDYLRIYQAVSKVRRLAGRRQEGEVVGGRAPGSLSLVLAAMLINAFLQLHPDQLLSKYMSFVAELSLLHVPFGRFVSMLLRFLNIVFF